MFKKKVKLKIDVAHCDIRNNEYGNWIDLANKKDLHMLGPIVSTESISKYLKVKYTPILMDLGIAMTLPKHYRAEIKPRSSTFKRWGILLTNSVGEIEANYSENWLANVLPTRDVTIPKGTRLFQFQISLKPNAPWYMKIADLFTSKITFEVVDNLTTNRSGFGSTG